MPRYNAIAKSCYTTFTFELEKDIFHEYKSTNRDLREREERTFHGQTRQERMELHTTYADESSIYKYTSDVCTFLGYKPMHKLR